MSETAQFSDRMALALPHERAVAEVMAGVGWFVDRWGTELLSRDLHRQLLHARSPLRFQPDMVAVRENSVLWLEAKTVSEKNKRTGNVSVQKECLSALLSLSVAQRTPIYFVWWDMTATPVAELAHCDHKCTGPDWGNGSGTPYWLAAKDRLTCTPITDL